MSWVVTEVDASGRPLWRSKWLPTRDVAAQVAEDLRNKLHGAAPASRLTPPLATLPPHVISSLLTGLPVDDLGLTRSSRDMRKPPAPTARL